MFEIVCTCLKQTLFFTTCSPGEVFEKSYLGTVTNMKLNGYYAAALFEGKIQLHMVSLLVEAAQYTYM